VTLSDSDHFKTL